MFNGARSHGPTDFMPLTSRCSLNISGSSFSIPQADRTGKTCFGCFRGRRPSGSRRIRHPDDAAKTAAIIRARPRLRSAHRAAGWPRRLRFLPRPYAPARLRCVQAANPYFDLRSLQKAVDSAGTPTAPNPQASASVPDDPVRLGYPSSATQALRRPYRLPADRQRAGDPPHRLLR